MPPDRPLWVRFGLWGVPNRASAWFFCWVMLAGAVAFVFYGLIDPIYLWGGLFLLGAIGYYAAIRWMDKHNGW